MLELAKKDLKTGILTVFHESQMLGRNTEDIKKKSPKLHFNDVLLTTIAKKTLSPGINCLPFPQTVNCVLSHCEFDKILVQMA